jgi:large subunit ribosomal protein L16
MLLQPKRTKYKKIQKGKLHKFNFRSNKLQFGEIGLKAAKSGTISSKQIEAARQAIVRKLNRKGKL